MYRKNIHECIFCEVVTFSLPFSSLDVVIPSGSDIMNSTTKIDLQIFAPASIRGA